MRIDRAGRLSLPVSIMRDMVCKASTIARTTTFLPSARIWRRRLAWRGVIEKDNSGVLALVNPQPLSPQALIHWRPSASDGFSLNPFTAPSAPYFTSWYLRPSDFLPVRTILPFTAAHGVLVMSTSSAVTPSFGVEPLHMPREEGICW